MQNKDWEELSKLISSDKKVIIKFPDIWLSPDQRQEIADIKKEKLLHDISQMKILNNSEILTEGFERENFKSYLCVPPIPEGMEIVEDNLNHETHAPIKFILRSR